jgi:hypothetical protein
MLPPPARYLQPLLAPGSPPRLIQSLSPRHHRAVAAALSSAGRMDDAVRLFLECSDRGLIKTIRCTGT